LQPDFSYVSYESNTISPSSTEPTLTVGGEQYAAAAAATAAKRKTPPEVDGSKPAKKVKKVGPRSDSKVDVMTNGDGEKDGEGSASKPKRVRTGCLTCRVS